MGIAVASKSSQPAQPINTRSANRENITLVIGIFTAATLGLIFLGMLALWIRQPVWQRAALTSLQGLALIVAWVSFSRRWIKTTPPRIYLLITATFLSMAGMAIFAEGVAVQTALVLLSYCILITSVTVTGETAERCLSFGMLAAWVTSLVGFLPILARVGIPAVDLIFPTLLGIFIMVYATLVSMEYISASLRIRLILTSMLVVLLPLLAVTSFQFLFIQNSFVDRIRESLSSAANQTAIRVDDFLETNRFNISQDAILPVFGRYLELSSDRRSVVETELDTAFQALQKRSPRFLVSYGLLDVSGMVVRDFNMADQGQLEGDTEYFSQAFRGRTYASNIIFSEKDKLPYVYFSSPVYGTGRTPVGVLRAKFDAAVFQSLLMENDHLVGQDASPILIDENTMRLGDATAPHFVYQTLAPLSEVQTLPLRSVRRIPSQANQAISTNYSSLANTLINRPAEKFFTANLDAASQFFSATRLNNKPWTVLYAQDASALNRLSAAVENSILFISCLLAGLVAMLSTSFARAITRPITRLTETAQKISTGDLSVNAPVSNDEIGTMANAFNIMTGRLRQLINDLEDRVRARTQELAERNETLTIRGRQLQTISEVARGIASTQDLESLLTGVTRLVSERFGFYHVGIFLIDENREYAVLRAANSEGGQRMLARQHKLKVGQVGIVGHVTGKGLPRIATDVGSDSVYFNNRDLPFTRSEMALPLLAGSEVIGALDVQSMHSNAFLEQDIELFSTLADQVAIAILNSRAYEETSNALEEARKINQRYLHQEWEKEGKERPHYTYEFTQQGLVARDQLLTPEVSAVLESGEIINKPAVQQEGESEPAVLGVPIKLRGETIGIIHLQDQGAEDREWVQEEINTVQSIADQVAQALENARLFEQTVRRAERERKVLEITGKIRSTNDPQVMLKIAMEELQRALRASKTQVILNGNSLETGILMEKTGSSTMPGPDGSNPV